MKNLSPGAISACAVPIRESVASRIRHHFGIFHRLWNRRRVAIEPLPTQ